MVQSPSTAAVTMLPGLRWGVTSLTTFSAVLMATTRRTADDPLSVGSVPAMHQQMRAQEQGH